MDITSTPTPTNTNTNTKSPETGSPDHHQTGTARIQAAKHLTFTNGVLKRHQPTGGRHQHHHHHHQHHPIVITYKECLKNHAASLGGHALDGCGEFMPSPTATATDPTSLKCAACGCHRNFHRREPEDNNTNGIINLATATGATHLGNNPITNANATATIEYQPHHRHHPPPPPPPTSQRSPGSASPPPISSSYYPSAPNMLLALSGSLQSAQENMNMIGGLNVNVVSSSGRKRFRTKFSQTQKEKMYQFAERVGWKMQKRDEEMVREFCNEVGVDRTVLKVWMHNNKNTFGKRDLNNGGSSGGDGGSGGGGRINLYDHDHTRSNNGNKNGHGGGGGDDQEEEEDSKNIISNSNSHNNNNNNNSGGAATGLQNLNHQFESESVAHIATANGSSSSS